MTFMGYFILLINLLLLRSVSLTTGRDVLTNWYEHT